MIKYKITILDELNKKGFSTYRLKKDKIFSEGTIQKFRNKDTTLSLKIINELCKLLECQPGDIIEYVEEN